MTRPVRSGGPRKYWLAGSVFAGIGLLTALVIPAVLDARATDVNAVPLGPLRALGGAFLTLGGVTLLMAALIPEVERAAPHNAEVWEWWIDFVGGLLGAAMFGVPASLVFPLVAFLYIDRPNWAFPDPGATFCPHGAVALLFTGVGLVTLTALVHLGRTAYQRRPRWKR